MRKTSVIVALGLLTGCFSVDVAESPVLGERSAGHVYVSNWGWTLFGCVPLVCGNANFDSWCPVTFFKDEIRPDIAYDKLVSLAERKDANLEDEAKRVGAKKAINVATISNDEAVFLIAFLREKYHTTAVLVK